MSMQIIGTGRQKPVGVKLTTTNATTIVAGPSAGIDTIEALCYSCGTSTTLSLWLTDGTTNWYLLNGETIAANSHAIITDFPLQLLSGWSLKAQAGAADRIDIIAITARSTQNDTARR